MEDRSKRTGAVRPQLDERCGEQRECDSVLSTTNDENDEELNDETDDEDMEDGETECDDGSAWERNIRDPGQPTVKEYQEHTKIMVQVLCDGTRRELTAQEIGCSRRFGWSAARVNGLWVSWREGL